MNNTIYRIGIGAVVLANACLAAAYQVKSGDRVPKFSVMSMDGKRLFSKDLQQGPAFLYFIRDGDSVSQQATSYIQTMLTAYGGTRSTWYGVINAKLDRARSYQAEISPAFRLVRDEDQVAGKMLGIENAPTVIEVNSRGRVVNVWHGFSAPNLKSINTAFAEANHVDVKWVDFSKAPATAVYGTNYSTVTLNNHGG